MSMSKKDYEAVAGILNTQIRIAMSNKRDTTGLCNAAADMAGVFARDNPNFDRARFLAACGTAP